MKIVKDPESELARLDRLKLPNKTYLEPHSLILIGEGELEFCEVCKCAEGTLLSSCPGKALSGETQDLIMSGKIADFQLYKIRKEIMRPELHQRPFL